MSIYRGDFELSDVINELFITQQVNGELTGSFRSQPTPANPPTFALTRLSDGQTVTNGPPTVVVNTNGVHSFTWDTSQSTDAEVDSKYVLTTTDGEVNDGTNWISVADRPILEFGLAKTSSGKLNRRVIRLLDGTIVSAVSGKQFTVQIPDRDHSLSPHNANDFYANLGVTFQTGDLFGHSKNILRSLSSGTNVTFIMQEAFPATPSSGDELAIIPEEQVSPIAVAHITAIPHTGEYYCLWTVNGKRVNPDNNQTWISASVLDTGTSLFSDQLMSLTTLKGWYYQNANLPPANSSVEIQCRAYFDGVESFGARPYPRTA